MRSETTMTLEYLLTCTRSARKSLDLDASIDLDDIRECLRIGLQAANGSNQQSWRWLVITDSDMRNRIGGLYRDAYLRLTGGRLGTDSIPAGGARRLISSTEWLVEHLSEVPLLVIPCYQPYMTGVGSENVRPGHPLRLDLPGGMELPVSPSHQGVRDLPHDPPPQPRSRGQEPSRHSRHVRAGLPLTGRPLAPRPLVRPAERRPLAEVVAVDGWTGGTI